ncbi:MAG: autotransporter-associated beta strand repeat-containing protein [Thermoguttaceae bacterium]|nr:autotransporter-associated beta strand repeat-containing protein [Thermoguttaceae bacterium]
MHRLPLCLFLSLFAWFAGTACASVIVNGVDTGSDTYTVKDSTDTAAVFTGSGTIIQTGSDVNPARYTGSFTGFSGVLRLTRTTGEFWFLNSPNLVKGEGKDLEMNIAADNATLVFNDPDAENPITYHFSVLNGTGTVRTSNGTLVQTCTLVLGTDTANYTPVNGNNYSGNIIQWAISGGQQSKFNLIKVGANTQILSGDNSSGVSSVEIQGGVLEAASANALGSKKVKLNGGTLRLDQAIDGINYVASSGDYTRNGTLEVNAAEGKSWRLDKYPSGANVNFVKTGAGTVIMSGNYSGNTLNSAEIKEGKIQLDATAGSALVFPKNFDVKIDKGACVEYLSNPGNNQNICYFVIDGGELISNTGQHLTVTNVTLRGGTMTGVGTSSTAYGNFLIDGKFIVDVVPGATTASQNLSEINANAVEFAFRTNSSREIQVNAGAQLDINATMVSGLNTGAINKTGDGVLNFTKANTQNRSINVNAGTLKLTGDGTLGIGSTTVSSGATLEIGPANPIPDPDSEDETATITPVKTISSNVILNGTGISNGGAMRIMGDTNFDGTDTGITLNTDASIYVGENATGTVTYAIWGKTNANTLTKTGPGTFIIATPDEKNSIKGVVIQGGVLEAATANALGAKNVKLDGGTLRLDLAINGITYAPAEGDYTPNGTIEVHADSGQSWNLDKYQTGNNINFVKTGEGTVVMTGDYHTASLKSAEIKEGKIQIDGNGNIGNAKVFPAGIEVKVDEGATVEYLTNPMAYGDICTYSLYGGELKTNMANHLTTGHVNLYGGTLTGTGGGSASYGNFLFDGNFKVYPSEEYGNVSEINADFVDFAFRNTGTKEIQVMEGAQLDVNAVVKYTSAIGTAPTAVIKSGAGVLNFTKTNTYNLPTTVKAGTLRLSEDGTLGDVSKAATVNSGATLEIANTKTVENALTISGTGVSSAGAVNFSDDGTISGAVTLGANSSINVAEGKNGTLSGSVAASNFTLTKTGPGTLTIGDACVVASNLVVSQGVLDLSGTVSGLEVQDGASAILNGTSTGDIAFSGTWLGEPGGEGMNLEGAMTFEGALDLPTEIQPGLTIRLLSLGTGGTLNGESDLTAIAGLLTDRLLADSARYWDIVVQDGGIMAFMSPNKVPEPATWLLLALGFGGLMVWKKRIKK